MNEMSEARPGSETAFAPLQHTDLTALAYQAIRAKILQRHLKVGSQIPVDAVALDLGVSRTPVVDALKRLAGEGLVEIRARRGCFVKGMSVKDISDILETREALELHGVRLAFRAGRHNQLATRLTECIENMQAQTCGDIFTDYDEFCRWDRAFHVALVEDSGNRHLTDTYVNLHVHVHIMRVHYLRHIKSASIVNHDHDLIVAALKAGDQAGTEQALTNHLQGIKDRVILNLEEEGGRL